MDCGCRLSAVSVHYGFRILKMYEILCETKLTLKYVVNKNDLLSFIPFGQLGYKEKNPLLSFKRAGVVVLSFVWM